MRLYVARPAKRSKVAGVKSPRLHIKGAACAPLDRAYMVDFCSYGCEPLLLAVLANGVG